MTTTTKKHIRTRFYTETDYQVRHEFRGGRDYTVVPVVMLVEGVHNGSGGAILHLPQYYSQNPDDWNGVPATAGHPRVNGDYVLANEADADQWVVGYVENARIEDNKLKAEVWIDDQRAIAINPEVLNYINEGKPLDVSTGLLSVDRDEQGQHNGEQYEAVTIEYYPDHLALLPGEQGACSWRDGCGIRNNKQTEDIDDMSPLTQKQINELKTDRKEGVGVQNRLQTNEMGFRELSRMVQGMLDRLDSEARVHYLKEIWDDYFVYTVYDRDQGWEKHYRQSYSVDEQNNDVNFEGDPMQVRENIEYVPIQTNGEEVTANEDDGDCGCGGMKRTKFNNNQDKEKTMSDKKTERPSGEVMDKVSALVNNENTRFTKDDREWLLNLNEAQLTKLEPKEAEAPEVTREQAIQALQEDLSDPDRLVEILPDTTKSHFQNGIKTYKEKRESLIKHIQTNTSKDTWPTEELEGMEMTTLERLAKSVNPTDYSVNGSGPEITNNASESEGDLLLPAGVELES